MTLEAKNLNEQISNLKEYEVILHKNIEEVDSEGWFLKHKKTGARIVLLANDDDNKVFNIDLEHLLIMIRSSAHYRAYSTLWFEEVSCYDPFMELVKGHLTHF